jgi:hypothetical protein
VQRRRAVKPGAIQNVVKEKFLIDQGANNSLSVMHIVDDRSLCAHLTDNRRRPAR